jgi:hypothetical protein
MMKKLLTLITCCVLGVAAHATASHHQNYLTSNLDTPGQILTFQKTTNSWMNYINYFITSVYGVEQVSIVGDMYMDCMITKNDLSNGDEKIPIGAKIVGFQLDGYYDKQLNNKIELICWLKNTGATAIENTTVNSGYLHNGYLDKLNDDWRYCDTTKCTFSSNASEQNPQTLYDVNFYETKPFVNTGENILMTILSFLYNYKTDIHYLCSPAQTEIATFFRSGNYGYGGPATTGSSSEIDNMVMAESYQLPAFRWKYYTNDIFVTVNLLDPAGNAIAPDDITAEQPDGRPLLSIYDMTAQKQVAISGATPNAEGFVPVTPGQRIEVLNVDYTHQYRVMVKSATCGQDEVVASFGAISDDIDLTFTMQQEQTDPDPVRGDLNGDGKVDIADVNISINTMLGKEPSTELSDLNGDGRTDIADVNIEINLMLGKDI